MKNVPGAKLSEPVTSLTPLTSHIDIYRSAHALIRQHGEAAAIEAAMKSDAMLDRGDLDGAALWREIVAAVNDLQREEPKPGERRH